MANSPKEISIVAVGDLSFKGKHEEKASPYFFSEIKDVLLNADLAIGNLECVLIDAATSVPGKCTLKASPTWAHTIADAGFNIVSLANNHLMDYGPAGLLSTIKVLKNAGIKFLGAGNDINEAAAPLFINVSNTEIALLARTSVVVASPCYATEKDPGVALFGVDETINSIKICKKKADIVILLLHWGIEEYHYPTPKQRDIACRMVNSGVDIILGHHPHVLQGLENIKRSLVIYSLGNFVFDEFEWIYAVQGEKPMKFISKLSQENRRGGMLKVLFSKNGVETSEFLPTVYTKNGLIKLDDTSERENRFYRLCSRLDWPLYNLIWKIYAIKLEWNLRIMPLVRGKRNWSKVKKIRLKHFKELAAKMSRSAKITSEKTTDPYG